MLMIPRDPFEALTPLREAMSRLFEESFAGPRFELFVGRTFPVDIYETEDKLSYVIEAALPGLKLEEVQVKVEGDMLTISVVKKGEEKVEKGSYVRRERYEGEMSRTFTLPGIEAAKVEATYEHGVLKLLVPKAEVVKPKEIPIQVKEAAGAR